MNIEFVDLPEISIIGKEGLCTKEKNIVKDLWNEANSNFFDIKDLGMKYSDGTYVGFWGAMSDETRSFLPWTEQFTKGLYLAGIQTDIKTNAPIGWTKWIMPARRYLTVEVGENNYHEIFNKVINDVIPEKELTLVGAVCDFTDPKTEKNKLFFPIEINYQNTRDLLNKQYKSLVDRYRELSNVAKLHGFKITGGFYNGHYHKNSKGIYQEDSYPIPVISVSELSDIEIDFDEIVVTTKIKKEQITKFNWEAFKSISYEIYGVNDYLHDYGNNLNISKINENTASSSETEFFVSFSLPLNTSCDDMMTFLKKLVNNKCYY